MNNSINYSQYNFSDIGIAQQTMPSIQPIIKLSEYNISSIINLYQECWYLIINDYDIVIITVIIIEIMIILMVKDLYRRYKL